MPDNGAALLAACVAGAAAGCALTWTLASRLERDGGGAVDSAPPAEPTSPRRLAPAGCCAACSGGGPFTPLPARADAPKPDPFDPRPRSSVLSWDDYFMAIAFLSSQRSKDPKKQVGACIVNSERIIVGIGYNGFPRGCADEDLPWAKLSTSGDVLQTKTPYVVHAEANAILNTNAPTLRGAHLYVTMYPCCECAKLIIQCGIREVTYYEAKNVAAAADGGKPDPLYVAASKMLSLAGVRVQQHRAQAPLVLNLFGGSGALLALGGGGAAREVQSTPRARAGGAAAW